MNWIKKLRPRTNANLDGKTYEKRTIGHDYTANPKHSVRVTSVRTTMCPVDDMHVSHG